MDVLTPEQRRRTMSKIRAKNTSLEVLLRQGLHSHGLRYRLHQRNLPGSPDVVFRRFRTALFVHGCFWHAHNCSLFKLPETRRDFWKAKMLSNSERDSRSIHALRSSGWRVVVVWECALRGRGRPDINRVVTKIETFLIGKRDFLEIMGAE